MKTSTARKLKVGDRIRDTYLKRSGVVLGWFGGMSHINIRWKGQTTGQMYYAGDPLVWEHFRKLAPSTPMSEEAKTKLRERSKRKPPKPSVSALDKDTLLDALVGSLHSLRWENEIAPLPRVWTKPRNRKRHSRELAYLQRCPEWIADLLAERLPHDTVIVHVYQGPKNPQMPRKVFLFHYLLLERLFTQLGLKPRTYVKDFADANYKGKSVDGLGETS